MKLSFSIIFVSFLFMGCSVQPRVILPTMSEIKPKSLSWTDMIVDGKQVHVLDRHEWEDIRVELINRRITGNTCINIINNFNKDK